MNKLITTFCLSLLLIGCNTPTSPVAQTPPAISAKFFYPVSNFTTNITKKFFGNYITPKNSPVQPEKFTGYGGVMVIEHQIEGKTYSAIYGHLRLSSIEKNVGEEVKLGKQIAVLGTAYSKETDGERKHLHFGLIEGSSTSILGYVQTKSALLGWIDPLEFFKKLTP